MNMCLPTRLKPKSSMHSMKRLNAPPLRVDGWNNSNLPMRLPNRSHQGETTLYREASLLPEPGA